MFQLTIHFLKCSLQEIKNLRNALLSKEEVHELRLQLEDNATRIEQPTQTTDSNTPNAALIAKEIREFMRRVSVSPEYAPELHAFMREASRSPENLLDDVECCVNFRSEMNEYFDMLKGTFEKMDSELEHIPLEK
jgi:hypothetical protein